MGDSSRRILACPIAALVALACLLASSGATAAPLPPSSPLYNPGSPLVDENPEVSAEYRGKMTLLWEIPAIEGGLEHVHRTATMEWVEGVAGPVDQIEYTGVFGAGSLHWKVASLSGSVTEDSTEGGGNPVDCSGTFSPTSTDGGEQGVFVPLETPGHPASGGNPATNPDYSVRPPFGIPSQLLASSAPPSHCQTSEWNSNGNLGWGGAAAFGSPAVQTEWSDVAYPTVYFPPGGNHTQALNFHYACEPPSCGPAIGGDGTRYGKVTLDVESSITFSSPGLGSGGAPVTSKGTPGAPGAGGPISCGAGSKPTCQDKKAAQEDLRSQLRPLALECGLTALGAGLVVAGVVAPETGAGVALAALGPTGAMMDTLSGTACGLLIKRMYDDAEVVKDPPSKALRRIARPAIPAGAPARLPSCRRYAASVRSYCKSLGAAVLRYLAAIRRGDAIDSALVTTVDRISGAVRAHDVRALALQKAQASRLRSGLGAADGAQRAAGAAIAALIRARHVAVRMSQAQVQVGVERAFAGASRHHLSQATIEGLAGAGLAAEAADVLAALRK